MEFTYICYKTLIQTLIENKYKICSYHNYTDYGKCAILRHDVDNALDKALEMAEIEKEMGVSSTYFIMLTTDFYNLASKKSIETVKKIHSLGHEIGLHFDEVKYDNIEGENIQTQIIKEAHIMEEILDLPIKSVSMHRPSKETLSADYQIPGLINSYGKIFFNDFKYLSDSRRNWREDVMNIIKTNKYDKLHILTHAFWYYEKEKDIKTTVKDFILDGVTQRYNNEKENMRDFEELLKLEEVAYGN